MAEHIPLRLFWAFMLLCAASALATIWMPGLISQKLVPTFFIIGFANFLMWAPLITYRFLEKS